MGGEGRVGALVTQTATALTTRMAMVVEAATAVAAVTTTGNGRERGMR